MSGCRRWLSSRRLDWCPVLLKGHKANYPGCSRLVFFRSNFTSRPISAVGWLGRQQFKYSTSKVPCTLSKLNASPISFLWFSVHAVMPLTVCFSAFFSRVCDFDFRCSMPAISPTMLCLWIECQPLRKWRSFVFRLVFNSWLIHSWKGWPHSFPIIFERKGFICYDGNDACRNINQLDCRSIFSRVISLEDTSNVCRVKTWRVLICLSFCFFFLRVIAFYLFFLFTFFFILLLFFFFR